MFREEKMLQQGNGADEIQDGHHVREMIVHNPFLEDLLTKCSVHAFEHMLFQFSQSHNYICKEEE